MKKLPRIYKNQMSSPKNNNKKCCYLEKNKEIAKNIAIENKVINKEVVDEKIENTLKSIFKKTGYPYNIRVYIKTKDKEYDTYLVARTERKITTLDNEVIYLTKYMMLLRFLSFQKSKTSLMELKNGLIKSMSLWMKTSAMNLMFGTTLKQREFLLS